MPESKSTLSPSESSALVPCIGAMSEAFVVETPQLDPELARLLQSEPIDQLLSHDGHADAPTSTLCSPPPVAIQTLCEATVEAKPEVIQEAKPAPVVEAKPEVVVEAKPEPVAQAQPEVVVEAQPEPVAQAKPEVVAQAQPEPVAQAQPEVLVKSEAIVGDESSEAADKAPSGREAKRSENKTGEALFSDLELSDAVHEAIRRSGYTTPTEVQSQIIPHMLAQRDLLAQSQTGTGKTAAFALPIISNIDVDRHSPQVLVLTPTRELAIQVAKSFSTYASCTPGFAVAAIYGGQDYEPQLRQLRRGVHVVVGTPGRVIDHINRGSLKIGSIETLVLDEADEMLNMGFLEDVQYVLEHAPEQRQIALFSATLPPPIRTIADRYLNDPVRVTIKKKAATADLIRQRAVFVAMRDKLDALARFLDVETTEGVIVFTKTKDSTITVADQLARRGFAACAINGDMPQKVRQRTIEQLTSGEIDVLVATDVAARGLDVQRISHVFNYDLPHDTESYVHRIGRTGRAGRSGEAIIFLSSTQRRKLQMIERATGQPIEIVTPPSADDINAARIVRFKEQITAMTAEQDLSLFKDLLNQYSEETGKPMLMIAAALAQIAQQGRPFFEKDVPKKKRQRDEREQRTRGGSRFGDHEDFDSRPGRRGPGAERGGRFGRNIGRPSPGMTRYRIEVGHNDGVKPGNIVGAVANEAGIDGQCIGPIKINERFSTVDLPEGMPREIFETLQRTRVAGKPLQLSIDIDRGGDYEAPSHAGGGARREFKRPRGQAFGQRGKRRPAEAGASGGPGRFGKPQNRKRRKAKA